MRGFHPLKVPITFTAIGLVAGYYGRWVDTAAGWLVNVVVAFPFYVLIIILMIRPYGLFGTENIERL